MISTAVRTCFPVAAQALAAKAEEINKLNVFPVPDGDTGTNMSLTLNTVVKEVEALPADASMRDITKAITHGSLMGARGNSGVITSQILHGVAEGLCDAKGENATTADIARALRRGVKVAFKAVRKPVEGTILTVLKDVSAKADQCELRRASVGDTLDAIVTEAYESVARTPELLPVLKENGVVDSGAFGLATFIEGFVNALKGEGGKVRDFNGEVGTGKKEEASATDQAKARVADEMDFVVNDDWAGSQYRYCIEFLFKADSPDFDEEANLKFLTSMGDCELLVGSNPDYKIHVHSNHPDQVFKHMLEEGQIYNVFVHNMDIEAQERTQKIVADKQSQAKEAPEEKRELGFVAVAAGSGEEDILKSLGVDVVVSGGQTMNPSTADILAAIEKVNARNVVVLPNNGNIRMAAEAAASACDTAKVYVVPTKTVLQAFSAMFVVDSEASVEDNVQVMTAALDDIRDGEVTTAIRDSSTKDGTPIHKDDVIGIENGDIVVVGKSVQQVTVDLINRMQDEEEGDTLTILAGKDEDDETFQKLQDAIAEAQPDLELDAHRGEQPLYPVIFSIE